MGYWTSGCLIFSVFLILLTGFGHGPSSSQVGQGAGLAQEGQAFADEGKEHLEVLS